MKTIPVYILLSMIFFSCCAKEPVIIMMDCMPPINYPIYKGEITIAFCKITTIDSLKIINLDSLLNKIKYPLEAVRSGLEGGVTIGIKLDSTRIAKDIKFYNHIGYGIDESILEALKEFKFYLNYETEINDLYGILTFKFRVYEEKKVRNQLIKQPNLINK